MSDREAEDRYFGTASFEEKPEDTGGLIWSETGEVDEPDNQLPVAGKSASPVIPPDPED